MRGIVGGRNIESNAGTMQKYPKIKCILVVSIYVNLCVYVSACRAGSYGVLAGVI